MKFKFTGTDEAPDEIRLRGVDFAKGKPVEIEDEGFAAKLDALPYFDRVRPGRKPAK